VVRIYGGQYTASVNNSSCRVSWVTAAETQSIKTAFSGWSSCSLYPEACGNSIETTGLSGWSMFVATKERR
jgi:hypothetical protein